MWDLRFLINKLFKTTYVVTDVESNTVQEVKPLISFSELKEVIIHKVTFQ